MIIDSNLVNTPVRDYKQYRVANPDELPSLFLGFVMTNEYDNQRLKLVEKYNPIKLLYLYEKEDGDLGVLFLYGLLLPLNELGKEIHKKLLDQENNEGMNHEIYSSIINESNLSCDNCAYCLKKRVYPVDFKYFKKLTDDPIIEDKKILQHLLGIDENIFAFEKFGAFKVLIIT